MDDSPEYLARGERARLFPVLADTSKEGRSTSIVLSCLASVHEFGQSMLGSVGQKVGKRAVFSTYTEVAFPSQGDSAHRPDGLIVLKVGNREWKALVETKIGNARLDEEQIANYVALAKKHNIDAVVTISNQFTSRPNHHPIKLPAKMLGKIEIYHWSWMYIVTQADLLVSKDDIEDEDQRFILTEMIRFLTHQSTGVKSFDRMPKSWTDVVQKIADGAPLHAKSEEAQETVAAWHQEIRDISLMLSRQLNVDVEIRLQRPHMVNPAAREKEDVADLAEKHTLSTKLEVHNAAAPIDIIADARRRIISASMTLLAPVNRKSTKGRINWILKQLQKAPETDIHIKLHWQGRRVHAQHSLKELRENPEIASEKNRDNQVHRFEICMIRQLGKRFAQPRNFIGELEHLVSDFYEAVGQYLRAYQSPAPRVRKDRSDPESVTTKKLQNNEEIRLTGKTFREQTQHEKSSNDGEEFQSAVPPAKQDGT